MVLVSIIVSDTDNAGKGPVNKDERTKRYRQAHTTNTAPFAEGTYIIQT